MRIALPPSLYAQYPRLRSHLRHLLGCRTLPPVPADHENGLGLELRQYGVGGVPRVRNYVRRCSHWSGVGISRWARVRGDLRVALQQACRMSVL